MIIEPFTGTNLIRFGASESDATKHLGVPDKVYLNDKNACRLQYNELMMELGFDASNESLLSKITIYNPEAELFGRRLIGRKQKEVLQFIGKHFDVDPQLSDYGPSFSLCFKQDCTLELEFRFGILDSIRIVKTQSEDNELALANS
ncbi:hypothetical protein FLL45_11980 [Aliikangiella marina]|uniref:Uncharacterized protein n=1 Tax=Aliikangiella marina TaxID=1712262 RepID=A0A545T8R6_9GAMM|nr:hypothetical protein [Aliikangiella marina]TQV73585.1 hypothetical protein FLL45_11980 [Aliikangiella marina]